MSEEDHKATKVVYKFLRHCGEENLELSSNETLLVLVVIGMSRLFRHGRIGFLPILRHTATICGR